MSSVAVIRAQVESRHPGAFAFHQRSAPEVFSTGIAAVDMETGGIPKGSLTQVCAAAGVSSGKTTLLMSLLAQVTGKDQFCSVVDAGDRFDPASASASGVSLSRLLWIRCDAMKRVKTVEQAFKAADILLQNGGFGLIAMDLSAVEEGLIRKVPLTTWFRFARVLERMPTALVVLMAHSAAQSCAGLTLHIGPGVPRWSNQDATRGQILSRMNFDIEIARPRSKKPAQKANTHFQARPQWA